MRVHARQREAMRLAAGNEGQAAEAKSEAKSTGGKEWEWEFLGFYRCRTSLVISHVQWGTQVAVRG